jgi:hypothetical protein
MASANVELVRSIVAAWERGDFSSAEWAHPEIEFAFADGPSPQSSTGVASMAEALRDFLSAWQEYRAEVDQYRELDGERVLIRGGQVTKLVIYFDCERALADLGLAPEGGSP